jgi:hypothetical protein
MKREILVIGIAMLMGGFAFAQSNMANSKKVAEGNTNTPFGKYKIEVSNEPAIVDGESVTSYKITYENSPLSVIILVDKEKNCKNYIVVSEGLSVMYKCNGQYFGVNLIDEKYKKDGLSTDGANLNKDNYFKQKLLLNGPQEEVTATTFIASYYPLLLKKK